MESIWPDVALEQQMIADAENPSCNPNGTDRDVACHIKALLCRVRELEAYVDRCRDELERLLDVVHECDQVLIQMVLDNESFESQKPFHVLPIEDANHLPFNPLLNPPPGVCEMMHRYVGSMVDAELVRQAKDGPARAIFTTPEPNQSEITKAAADNPIPFTIVAQTANMAVVKVDGTEAIMVFGTEEMEP